jgi:hypothetical protein
MKKQTIVNIDFTRPHAQDALVVKIIKYIVLRDDNGESTEVQAYHLHGDGEWYPFEGFDILDTADMSFSGSERLRIYDGALHKCLYDHTEETEETTLNPTGD